MDTFGKLAMGFIVLAGAGLLLRNSDGAGTLINTTFSGFQSILSLGSGAPVTQVAAGGIGGASKQDPAIAGHI